MKRVLGLCLLAIASIGLVGCAGSGIPSGNSYEGEWTGHITLDSPTRGGGDTISIQRMGIDGAGNMSGEQGFTNSSGSQWDGGIQGKINPDGTATAKAFYLLPYAEPFQISGKLPLPTDLATPTRGGDPSGLTCPVTVSRKNEEGQTITQTGTWYMSRKRVP
ncbi:MAG TPA: hypothetical protein VLA04_02630 [Verrucomicrobiae bacterium]|nr:hypothetical protein [Verrucomicrobiae bacterium]